MTTNFFERISKLFEHYGYKSVNDFALNGLGWNSPEKLNRLRDSNKKPSFDILTDVANKFENISVRWLLTGEGEMYPFLNGGNADQAPIPFYGDVASIGGKLMAANNVTSSPTAYIRAGDWFPGATAAFRHYGESMIEYPSGCVLAGKEIKDLKHGIIPGQNYVVEYGEDYNLITKRLGNSNGKLMAYSTNSATYPDGTLIHQPFPIIGLHKAFLVLGYIVISQGSGIMIVPEHDTKNTTLTL